MDYLSDFQFAEGDTDRGTELLEQYISGDITKEKIKDIYREKREEQNYKKRQRAYKEWLKQNEQSEQSEQNEQSEQSEQNEQPISPGQSKPMVRAEDILNALKPEVFGLDTGPFDYRKTAMYEVFPEFRVFTGTTRNAARIDALIASNIDAGERGLDQYHITLRAVEIKVSKSDLQNDHKMTEYSAHADRSYIAVPADLVEVAEILVPESWGVLSYDADSGALTLKREAASIKGRLRSVTLETIAIKKCNELCT